MLFNYSILRQIIIKNDKALFEKLSKRLLISKIKVQKKKLFDKNMNL